MKCIPAQRIPGTFTFSPSWENFQWGFVDIKLPKNFYGYIAYLHELDNIGTIGLYSPNNPAQIVPLKFPLELAKDIFRLMKEKPVTVDEKSRIRLV